MFHCLNIKDKRLLAIVATLAVLILPFAILDIRDRLRFHEVQEVSQHIEESIIPNSAIKEHRVESGEGLLATLKCFPDERCPQIRSSWFVAMQQGSESKGIEDYFKQNGFTIVDNQTPLSCQDYIDRWEECSMSFKRDGIRIDVGVIKTSQIQKPEAAPLKWWQVSFTVEKQ